MSRAIPTSSIDVAEALLAFTNVARRSIDQELARHSSSLSRVKLLMFLDSEGPSRMSAIAAGLGIAVRSAIDAVESLERAGMIARSDDPTNRRAVIATMTPSGRDALRKALRIRELALNEMFGGLTATENAQILKIVAKLRANVSRKAGAA